MGPVGWRVDMRRPAFGRHGRWVVAVCCTWELVALPQQSPVPTISETVDRHPWFGLILLGLLAHHWYLELEQVMETIAEQ